LSLKDRRQEYEWPPTQIERISLVTDKKSYASDDTVKVNVAYRIVGGLREAFHPDVWTVAWEDFDKRLPLTLSLTLNANGGIRPLKLEEVKKEVRRASFYWSRDPDLPYRIWVMIMPEDGGPPKIPRNVEDAKSKMLDVEKEFAFPASSLSPGRHELFAGAKARWTRRSFIEKGEVESKSKPVMIHIE
jgi:hypothetical protein